ncbi:MAG TPA: KpsF/GutQ family sugar-phosphate isomerase [Stellaceae bacterium]|nr:KpsF/GutQ family sugar-phosphate isomerase [Stellaceae bacterium]
MARVLRKSPDLDAAQRVLRTEIAGLEALAAALDGGFATTVDLFAAVKGRVIVTGMGKSGHVARKIAATFSSTGTPAQFVHPGEASHGDLGAIAGNDAVLALSNSGDTAELDDIVAHCRRFRLPLIAMTAGDNSALAEAADVRLLLPSAAEACPMGLAPTTSTTMMMALGDALAIALLERKGFSSRDFQVLHPGGRLGRKLLRVADVMRTGEAVPRAALGTAMSEAIPLMTEKALGCVGILDAERRLVGIITDGDLRRHMGERLFSSTVDQVMTPDPQTIRPQALAAEALGRMNAPSRPITSLFVVDEDERQVLGILHIHDLLRAGVA